MADNSKIEWTDASWNVVVGCDKISPGCKNCYAIRDAHRMAGNPNEKIAKVYRGLTEIKNGAPNWTGIVRFVEDRLDQPLRWKRPRMIFVNSQSDLFHEAIDDLTITRIFNVMALADWHIFQILTKRPVRMLEFVKKYIANSFTNEIEIKGRKITFETAFKHVWFGVSCENQETADERIPLLLQTPAAIRWISAEPLIGEIDLDKAGAIEWDAIGGEAAMLNFSRGKIDWVVAGGESGPNARPMHPDWARKLRDQCIAAGIPFFFKQNGAYVWRETWGDSTGDKYIFDDGVFVNKVGKKAAGRLLDGREWNQMPGPR